MKETSKLNDKPKNKSQSTFLQKKRRNQIGDLLLTVLHQDRETKVTFQSHWFSYGKYSSGSIFDCNISLYQNIYVILCNIIFHINERSFPNLLSLWVPKAIVGQVSQNYVKQCQYKVDLLKNGGRLFKYLSLSHQGGRFDFSWNYGTKLKT